MNRKQKRDWLRSFKGDMSPKGRQVAGIRRSTFGNFGLSLKAHFDSTGKGI